MGKPGPEQRESDREILRQVKLAHGPVATASEVAENLQYSRQNVNRILGRLENEGLVKSKEVGARARIWWVTEKGEQFLLSRD
jgi:DNA-binding MarR family transcriptional regulator